MAGESIELLKNYEPSKMHWPALHEQKIDGVPVRVFKQDGKIKSLTRQNEVVTSIKHIETLANVLLEDGESLVMELCINGKPFKEISGHVRRKNVQCPELVGWVFDFDMNKPYSYGHRHGVLLIRINKCIEYANCTKDDLVIRQIPAVIVYTQEQAEAMHDALMLANPNAEGSVLHSVQKFFQPGKRCWGTQRMKPVPTIDLLVVGFEEAISAETGLGLGMVGRINAEYNYMQDNTDGSDKTICVGVHRVTTTIGIGPGALNHTERKELWRMWKKRQYTPRIAEIRYMRDDSYDALRQPTFKCWRDDKKEPDSVN